jgi:hypothetical protein
LYQQAVLPVTTADEFAAEYHVAFHGKCLSEDELGFHN